MTVRLAMSYSEVGVGDVEHLIKDSNIAVEQKVDGTRSLVEVVTGLARTTVTFLGRGGGPLKHTAAMQHFDKIEAALQQQFTKPGVAVIDGEIMIDTGMFVAFDLPYLEVEGNHIVMPTATYNTRRTFLSTLFHFATEPLMVAKSEWGEEGKRRLFERVKANGGEGVMLKRLDSPYEPGKRVKHSVKAKFVKTADVVVTASTRGRNDAGREVGSFSFAAHSADGRLVSLGACSAIGKPETAVGDVIEVAYLYRGEGGGLVQPRMLRVRTDKGPMECTLDQFPIYSKEVLR